jgi:hypothetical protein
MRPIRWSFWPLVSLLACYRFLRICASPEAKNPARLNLILKAHWNSETRNWISRAKFIKHFRVGLHLANQKL